MKGIKTKFFLFGAALVLLVGSVGFGNSSQAQAADSGKGQTEINKGQQIEATNMNTGESNPANVNLTDNEAKDILNKLLPKAIGIVEGIFNGSGWFNEDETQTIPGEKKYCLVNGERWKTELDTNNVKSIADLKKVVEDVFTNDTAQQLLYSRYLEMEDIGLPLYKDYEGRLYVNTQNGGHGWATEFLIDTAKIRSQKDNRVEIALETTVLDDPDGKRIIKIEYVNGKWLMASGLVYAVSFPESDVPANFWGREHIQWAIDQQIVDGYPDDTFKPNATINRSEFLAMLIRAYRPADLAAGSDKENWASPYLNYALRLGWKNPPENDPSFTRGEVANYLANAAGKNYSTDDSIQYLLDLGLSNGKNGNSLEGYDKNGALTRAEAVAFIERFKLKHTELHVSPDKEEKYNRSDVFSIYKTDPFTVLLPKSWSGKYEVTNELHGDSITENFDFINISNKATGGVIFTITVWTADKWHEDGEEMAKTLRLEKIAEKGDYVFTIRTATDVQYNDDDPKLKNEYRSMADDIRTNNFTFELN